MYAWYVMFLVVVSFECVHKRHALIKPRLPLHTPAKGGFIDFTRKNSGIRNKCKVIPLKARRYIKAHTIFSGTVVSFMNSRNKWSAQTGTFHLIKLLPCIMHCE